MAFHEVEGEMTADKTNPASILPDDGGADSVIHPVSKSHSQSVSQSVILPPQYR